MSQNDPENMCTVTGVDFEQILDFCDEVPNSVLISNESKIEGQIKVI